MKCHYFRETLDPQNSDQFEVIKFCEGTLSTYENLANESDEVVVAAVAQNLKNADEHETPKQRDVRARYFGKANDGVFSQPMRQWIAKKVDESTHGLFSLGLLTKANRKIVEAAHRTADVQSKALYRTDPPVYPPR
jgi:hypothetical protein